MSINEEIVRLPGISYNTNVRVIAQDNEQIGVIPLSAALDLAYDKDMDLVLMSDKGEVPVCRIMDYGKFCFERDKKEKENRKKQQKMDIKEVQLSCRIDTNDFNTKANHARRFLTDGDKVRVAIRFKGRQMAHQEIGLELLERFAGVLADVGSVDKKPVLEGRTLTMFIVPLKK
ncbi:MAG: translation initiation factor IF-3 [Clostridia bacterium]|nr:translation initiation factor IF-3 [Clostridia bacterium]MBQ8214684.1 translation initiation factor IF-3 [Clostridia bacterium]MBQ8911371.1 translation initiation factor IF-3 [Clostridia bacterium]MBQ9129283.1 translation initiation factor IF-3 [Clostridia bacterium]